eukprot:CAMPEP_0118693236 /NCGR_PEP_ID=MMETSP0800-20121206/11788_1 /TAXON_ID=210618 ORGANISM="Striatella unipunctata, Strain CCMP2910" /NCGR_SAMPLE_ID=MMETSP0800 /ASSEMBLY_ACC=CAM_ASM_000638 /LENGTH=275 /DNA_ID=CAMNT_0006591433 /DNA_START=380 /DNA_END=1204 /DNA_ORIENTATION=-
MTDRQKDPITGNPRYGEKTQERVKVLLKKHDILIAAIQAIFESNANSSSNGSSGSGDGAAVVETIKESVRKQAEQEQIEKEMKQKEMEHNLLDQKKRDELKAQEEADRRREEMEQEQREREALSRRAEEARRARLDAERLEQERQARADYSWMQSIPKGPDGVRTILHQQLKVSAPSDAEYRTAVRSLHTIFGQIVARPEEPKFRRIRRNHAAFVQDVGRHAGGKELLVAAGFRLDRVDGVPSFFSREPDLETDMDAWSEWFDTLKATLQILSDE